MHAAVQLRELHRRHRPAAAGLLPGLVGRHDLPGLWNSLDPGELDPLDVADHGDVHRPAVSHLQRGRRFKTMMEAVATIPPFERFYVEHRDGVFGFLVRRVGRDRAEDAFQETFLRALKSYESLAHAENLRAWVFTIAARVAVDDFREAAADDGGAPSRGRGRAGRPTPSSSTSPTALPPKERAAVVLRYGYDLEYADIALRSARARRRRARRRPPASAGYDERV